MANLTETATYDAGVIQIDTGALISGGASGTANAPLKNLANRTAYLKSHVDALEAGGSASSVTMADDTTTNATYYPTFSTATSGTVSSLKSSSSKLTFNPSTGTLSATVINSLSDSRYKTNIRSLGYGLSTVLALTGYKYELIDSNQTSLGLIAQDVEKVVPEVVITDVDGKMGINYSAMIAVLVEAVKELTAKVATLEGK
ncbi:MAG: tail fiber domain-containing protein [Bacteroidetes bacterium]|nr:tail fiber domain-containing protein [Bacteroidota bacterium]